MAPPSDHALRRLLAERTWLRDLARALAGDGADDLEQEVWLKALRNPPQSLRSPRAWLGTVLRRKAIDAHRQSTRRVAREQRVVRGGIVEATDEVAARADTHRWVAQAVLGLPEPYHSTILLRYVEGLPQAEVARQQDVSIETVRTRQRRALRMLRDRLGGAAQRKRAAAVPAALGLGKIAAGTAGVFTMGTKLLVGATLAGACVAGLVLWNPDDGPAPDMDEAVPTQEAAHAAHPILGNDAPKRDTDAVAPPAMPPTEPNAAPRRPTWAELAPRSHVTQGAQVDPGVVAGRVEDLQGGALADLTVILWRDNKIAAKVSTAKDGRFQFDTLEEGTYVVSAHAAFANVRADVQPGGRALRMQLDLGLSIEGSIVTKDGGEPVAGMNLIARHADPDRYGPGIVQATTNEHGNFLLRGLPPGTYTITTRPRYSSVQTPAPNYLPTTVEGVRASTTDARIEVERGLTIAGLVLGPDGQPWTKGASVRASPRSKHGDVGYGRLRGTTTDPHGVFALRGLSDEPWDLTVAPREGAGVVHVARVPAGTSDVRIDLPAGQAITGRVVDPDGTPVPGPGYVWVTPKGVSPGAPGSVSALLDKKGSFRTTELDAGLAYTVSAMGFHGFGNGAVEGVYPSDDVVLVRLRAGATLSGRVRNGETPAARGIPVVARATELKGEEFREPWASAYGSTDPEGNFTLGGLKAGRTYVVSAGGGTSGFVGEASKVSATAPAADLTVQVVRGVRFRGRLVSADDEPLASIYLQVRSKDGAAAGRTDRHGRFSIAAAPKGKLTVGAMIGGAWTPLGTYEAPAADVTVRVPE